MSDITTLRDETRAIIRDFQTIVKTLRNGCDNLGAKPAKSATSEAEAAEAKAAKLAKEVAAKAKESEGSKFNPPNPTSYLSAGVEEDRARELARPLIAERKVKRELKAKTEYRDGIGGCNEIYFDKQAEGICYAYAVISFIIKGLMHDILITSSHPRLLKIYDRMHKGERLLAADLAGGICKPVFDPGVWSIYNQLQPKMPKYPKLISSFDKGGHPVFMLASILLFAEYSKLHLLYKEIDSNNLTHDIITAPKSSDDSRIVTNYKETHYCDDLAAYWVKVQELISLDDEHYFIVNSFFNRANPRSYKNKCLPFPAHVTPAKEEIIDHANAYYDITHFFEQQELDQLRKYEILHLLVGGFIELCGKVNPEYGHELSWLLCDGKILVCDGNSRSCAGITDVGTFLRSYLDANLDGFNLIYVFTPVETRGHHQYELDFVKNLKSFELMKRSDYEQYRIDLSDLHQDHTHLLKNLEVWTVKSDDIPLYRGRINNTFRNGEGHITANVKVVAQPDGGPTSLVHLIFNLTPVTYEERIYGATEPMLIDARPTLQATELINTTTYGNRSTGKGLKGINNPNDMCYMIVVLQCLSNTPPLRDFVLKYNTDGKGDTMIAYFKEMLEEMWDNKSDPKNFESNILKFSQKCVESTDTNANGVEKMRRLAMTNFRQGATWQQVDSTEFLTYFLHTIVDETTGAVPTTMMDEYEAIADEARTESLKKGREADAAPSDPIKRQEADAAEEAFNDAVKNTDPQNLKSWIPCKNFDTDTDSITKIISTCIQSNLTCRSCNIMRKQIEPVHIISFPLSSKTKEHVLSNVISAFFEQEEFAANSADPVMCPKCNAYTDHYKTLLLSRLPPVLFLTLKRWYRDDAGNIQKMHDTVDVAENIHMKTLNGDSSDYKLIGILHHHGDVLNGSGGGHYTADCLNDGTWYIYNDSFVAKRSTPIPELKTNTCYMLVYQKQ